MTEKNSTDGKDMVVTRTFNAPRELVWAAWTDPEPLKQWFGPKGFTMPTCKMDLRPGGTFLYSAKSPDGHEMWGKWVFRKVVKPERLVLVNSFSDEKGGITRHPLSATWPLEMLSTTTLAEENGKTLITIRWAPLNASETEIQTFDAGRSGMVVGWNGTFEQLDEYLAKAK